MKNCFKLLLLLAFTSIGNLSFSQTIIEDYDPIRNDSIRIGKGNSDLLPLIQRGFTLMLPKAKKINGVLIYLEDSGYDQKNKNSKQIYDQASDKGFAVLSISTEIPFDFYFSETSSVV